MLRRVIAPILFVVWSLAAACAPPAAPPVDGARSAPPRSEIPALGPPLVSYQPPVAASVRDGFRLPASPFGPGNRGIEYATAPGQPVWSAADGVVVFAGAVGGTLVVSIQHADGLRTTYTHLADVEVSAGARVGRGQAIGSATHRLHFGARLGTAYLDPTGLFEAAGGPARLVPDDDPRRRGSPL